MTKLEKKYNPLEAEKKWQKYWEDNKIFKFDWDNTKRENIYTIDTPPPTVSGTLHMGHISSFTHTDFIARFQRMSGKNVFYPIGFDDNGLPTERYVEKQKGIKGKEMPRNKFIKICQETIKQAEDVDFSNLFHSVSHSYDWSLKYQTIDDKSKHISQLSFLDLYNKGVLYRKDEPCIWDVIDQTALAQTEIEDKEFESQKNYLRFEVKEKSKIGKPLMNEIIGRSDNNFIEIMTTRPELLAACVGLMCHPSLYEKYKDKVAVTPLGVDVPIIPDEKADLEKGTGFVMCCTFGDQTDIEWWKKYQLELRICLNERGQIKLDSVKDLLKPQYLALEGLKNNDARIKILELLEQDGAITRPPEKITHPVKVGERSKFPIEFLIKKQWNIRVLNIKDELHKKTDEIIWHPDWMKTRMHNWIDGLSWDWTISRQRFSGISIPVWYSKRKGEEGKVIVADAERLPIDPLIDLPVGYTRDEVEGDNDVLDTWATSAVSPQINSWGITDDLVVDENRFKVLSLPFDLRPQAHEIIRTWAFCTLVKAHYHENKIPWKNMAISGWCLASDKTKMSKSVGNIIDPVKLITTKGSDALRYWAGNATLGLDTAYSEDQILIGQKLITKIFNSAKFVEMCFENLRSKNTFLLTQKMIAKSDNEITETIDKWLIYRMHETIKKATTHFENYEFNRALEVAETFFWSDFCDNYLEIAKVRCYGADGFKYKEQQLAPEQIAKINKEQQSALHAIYYVFNALLKLFAPFIPVICDEVYSVLYEEEFNQTKSVSAIGNWAKANDFECENCNEIGKVVIDVIVEVRKYKAEKNVSIKEIISTLKITCNVVLDEGVIEDLKNVCNVNKIEIKTGEFKVELN
ncbi:MAG: valine--tRNA ligase [Rickettsiales bacterium]|jgi:valyl-tRNA synthetase|nr:valine--tRNA ligase [Rickettsiales bacterium]